MAGLLYKDFVAIRGKIYVICAVVATVVAWALRILADTDDMEFLLVMTMLCLVLVLYMLVENKIGVDLMQVDERKKQKQYCISLPVSKKQYVAEKYVFMLLTFYFIQAFCSILCNILIIDCRTVACEQLLTVIAGLVPVLTCIMMFVNALELPFFVGLGYKKGNVLKQGIVVGASLAILVYLMFGNLEIFENFSVDSMVQWVQKHQAAMTALQMFAPCVVLIIYYISYRISCALFERREFEDE